MNEDELAAKVHGIYISESDSENSGNSDFDEKYEALRPPTISLKDKQEDIVKIEAFKVVCRKNNGLKRLYSKLNTNGKKPVGLACKCEKDSKINFSNRKKRTDKRNDSKPKSFVINKGKNSQKQSGSLIMGLSLQSKLNQSYVKQPFVKNITDYASAVKSNTGNGSVQTLTTISVEDSQNRIIKKSKPRRKRSGKGKSSSTILLTADFEKKINIKTM